jgi:hypothetical protein
MPYKIKNVALDPSRAFQRRRAAKMEMEPVINGARVRLNNSVTLTDEQYANNKIHIDQCVEQGVLAVEELGRKAAPVAAPVVEVPKEVPPAVVEAPPVPVVATPMEESSEEEEEEEDSEGDDTSPDSTTGGFSGSRRRRKRR